MFMEQRKNSPKILGKDRHTMSTDANELCLNESWVVQNALEHVCSPKAVLLPGDSPNPNTIFNLSA